MNFKLGKKKKAQKKDAATSELFAPEEEKKRIIWKWINKKNLSARQSK